MRNKKFFGFILFLIAGIQGLSAQGIIVLDRTAPSTATQVQATQQVVLKPGFHAVSTAGSFNAKIGQTNSLFPTNMMIAEGSTALTQNIFVPGIGQNYIKTTTYLTDDQSQSLTSYQYFDGLGRPSETVNARFTHSGADLVSMVEYDNAGRENIKWLPAVISGNAGEYVDPVTFKSASVSSNASDSRPYVENILEASPLNRISGEIGAGQDWGSSHQKTSNYQTNDATISYFYVNSSNLLAKGSNYDAASLYVTKAMDEDNIESYEFTDKLGRIVLKRNIVDGDNVDTYYVYNDLGQLSYVVPPKAVDELTDFSDDNAIMRQYCYLYKYDERGNCIYKRLPGCTPIYMVYDKADRLVLSQDGNQRKRLQGALVQWAVTKYDSFGRVVFTGLMYRSEVDSVGNYKSIRDVLSNDVVTDSYAGFASATPLTINYYDNYNFLSSSPSTLAYQIVSGYDKAYPVTATLVSDLNATGLLTGTRTYFLDGSGSNITAMYYDDKERVVQTRSSNHLGGYDIVYNAYNFTGKQLKTYKTHGINGATDTYKELYTYSYDNAQRLLTTTHQLNGGSTVTLVSNSYDELGRVQTKNTGNIDATTYTYNIRSWTTGINGSHFTENLYYNVNTANLPTFTPAYNGNIAGMQWSVPSESLGYNRAYTFGYDALNRLTDANYCGFNGSAVSGTTGRYNEHFAFDKMGNITNFVRYGLQANNSTMIYAKVDDLVLDHTGNQLTRVTDSGSNGVFYGDEEFVKNTINSGNSCAYDANGNRLYDSNSNIWGIKYNILNLPDAMQFYQGHQTNYTYDASGMKLKVIDKTAPEGAELPVTSLNTILTNPSVAMITTTDYVGNIIYENGTLKRILTSAGYWQDGTYYYFLKDHLGSNRVVITGSGGIAETSSYYPSGMRFGESAIILNNSIQPYRHTGHEMQEMHGLNWIDNLARFRTVSDGSGFTGVDPLAEKYYSISPYAYCAGNPVKFIDPTGMSMDDYQLKEDGKIELIKETDDKKDVLYATDENGNADENNSITVDKGILDKQKSSTVSDGTKYDYMSVKGNEKAESLFKFL